LSAIALVAISSVGGCDGWVWDQEGFGLVELRKVGPICSAVLVVAMDEVDRGVDFPLGVKASTAEEEETYEEDRCEAYDAAYDASHDSTCV
jgi:hypothetical protein